jgi:hypothetical protein
MAQPKGYAAFILFPTPKDDTSHAIGGQDVVIGLSRFNTEHGS